MTYADELRALAEWLDEQAAWMLKHEPWGHALIVSHEGKAAEVRALADKLQGKVVVRPHIYRGGKHLFANLPAAATLGQCTEAEAIANLQAALDAAERGDG